MDGHNTDGICREYNKDGCKYDETRCRFLHITVKKKIDGVEKRVSAKAELKEQKEKTEKREDCGHLDDEKLEGSVAAECGNNGGTIQELFTLVRDYYGEKEAESQGEVEEGESGSTMIDRGLSIFLKMDPKHDTWKEARDSSQEMKA